MDDDVGRWKQPRERRVVEDADVSTLQRMALCERAHEQHGPTADESHAARTLSSKNRPGSKTAAEPSVNTIGRGPALEEGREVWRQLRLLSVVERKARDDGLWRPVGSRHAEHPREHRKDEVRRVLVVEEGIGDRRQAERPAEVGDGLRQISRCVLGRRAGSRRRFAVPAA